MPLYSYSCNACDHEFETLVYGSESPACPSCCGADLTQKLSLIAKPVTGGADAPACDGSGACGMCCGQMCD